MLGTYLSHSIQILSMKGEIVQVELPKSALDLAEENGLSKEKLGDILKQFAMLEIVGTLSKLDTKQAEKLSDEMKAASWKKIKQKL